MVIIVYRMGRDRIPDQLLRITRVVKRLYYRGPDDLTLATRVALPAYIRIVYNRPRVAHPVGRYIAAAHYDVRRRVVADRIILRTDRYRGLYPHRVIDRIQLAGVID